MNFALSEIAMLAEDNRSEITALTIKGLRADIPTAEDRCLILGARYESPSHRIHRPENVPAISRLSQLPTCLQQTRATALRQH